MRESVVKFAERMEAKLREHDGKKPSLWKHEHPASLFNRVVEELLELREELFKGTVNGDGRDDEAIVGEAVDVANMVMMLTEAVLFRRGWNQIVFRRDKAASVPGPLEPGVAYFCDGDRLFEVKVLACSRASVEARVVRVRSLIGSLGGPDREFWVDHDVEITFVDVAFLFATPEEAELDFYTRQLAALEAEAEEVGLAAVRLSKERGRVASVSRVLSLKVAEMKGGRNA